MENQRRKSEVVGEVGQRRPLKSQQVVALTRDDRLIENNRLSRDPPQPSPLISTGIPAVSGLGHAGVMYG